MKKVLDSFFRKRGKETKRVARIPEEEIERLKREVSLERLVEAKGVRLTRHGADLHVYIPLE